MSTSTNLIHALKSELKAAGLTYAGLARQMGMAESSVKRIFASGDMSLSRIDQICRVLRIEFSDLAQRAAAGPPLREHLSLAQERAVVSNPKLMLAAMSCLSQWTFEQVVETYSISEVECIKLFVTLDQLGIIELRPLNRYRVNVAKTFRWLPDGPIIGYFREHVLAEYFGGAFDAPGELLSVVIGSINPATATLLVDRLRRVAEDFAQQHLADQRLPADQRQPFTLVLGMRSWWLTAFQSLKR